MAEGAAMAGVTVARVVADLVIADEQGSAG
jgi:hypothetical protein